MVAPLHELREVDDRGYLSPKCRVHELRYGGNAECWKSSRRRPQHEADRIREEASLRRRHSSDRRRCLFPRKASLNPAGRLLDRAEQESVGYRYSTLSRLEPDR